MYLTVSILEYRPNTSGVVINPFNIGVCINHGLDAGIMEIEGILFLNHSFDCFLDNVLEYIYFSNNLLNEIHRILLISFLKAL